MDKIITADGSETFFNKDYDELYHSKTGAVEEAVKKYAEPGRIAELAKNGRVRLLDICFGLGYNSCAAIDAVIKANPDCVIDIVGLEKHRYVFDHIQKLNPPFKHYDLIKELASSPDFTVLSGNIQIRVVLGDAVGTIKESGNLGSGFDAVFHDPFAPRRNPEMWTESIFTDVRKFMKPGSRLVTYSCARHVRDNLKKAGFSVIDGPKVGRRGSSTIAIA